MLGVKTMTKESILAEATPGDDLDLKPILDPMEGAVRMLTSVERGLRKHGYTLASVTADEGAGEKRGMRPWRQERAELFKRLKDAHPEWTQSKVATEAIDEIRKQLKDAHLTLSDEEVNMMTIEQMGGNTPTDETVRNDYRDMGWEWERAVRIR